ncbi:MAG: CDP-alcohol phosphatidyltransferase family protein [Gammaproteobacteria bacterium]|jgi:archaetidylinositol phosphate synthase
MNNNWTHKIARLLVKTLVKTPVKPNHITTVRLITGIIACVMFATGIRYWEVIGGFIWILSTLLDCIDGELARMRNQCSEWGHKFDYFSDTTVTALFFIGIGIGARDAIPELLAVILGFVAAQSVVVAIVLAERIDQLKEKVGEKAYPGIAGFNFDDILFLFALIIWLDWQLYFLIGASIGAPLFALLTRHKLRQINSGSGGS